MEEDQPQQIQAYYKLEFPGTGNGQGRDYYFQTLSVTIGRRPLPPAPGSPSSSSVPIQPQPAVDVHLGALKSVSRLHAKIDYDESIARFVFLVLGRNGAWVDDVWIAKGGKVPLRQRTKLQIANRTFYFQLPPDTTLAGDTTPYPSASYSPPVDVTSITPPAASSSTSPPETSTSPEYDIKQEPQPHSLLFLPDLGPPQPPSNIEKPPHTYAMLCYRALTALQGKATLVEICDWITGNFEWYRLNKTSGWQASLRHNLSMNNAFVKLPRGKEERGKGCFWSLHPGAAQVFETPSATGKPPRLHPYAPPSGPPRAAANHVQMSGSTSSSAAPSTSPAPQPPPAPDPSSGPSGPLNIPGNVSLPIVIGPVPPSAVQGASATPHLDAPPIVLHSGTLVLNPAIFSHLTQEELRNLERLGAQQALAVLQSYIVDYLKERMRGERNNKGKLKGKGRGRRKDGQSDASSAQAASSAVQAAPGVAPQTVASLLSAGPPARPLSHSHGSEEALATLAAAAASQSSS